MNWETIINSNLVGSLIGTIIAGLVTYKAMKKELNFQKNSDVTKEIEGFLKVCNIFNGYLKEVQFSINNILDLVQSDEKTYENIPRLQFMINGIDESLNKIESLPNDKIMIEIHEAYRLIITEIETINKGAYYLLTVLDNNKKDSVIQDIKKNNTRLNIVIDDFNKFKIDQEQKLEILKK